MLEHREREGDEACVFVVHVLVHSRVRPSVVILECPLAVDFVCNNTDDPNEIAFDCCVVHRSTEDVKPTQVAQSLHVLVQVFGHRQHDFEALFVGLLLKHLVDIRSYIDPYLTALHEHASRHCDEVHAHQDGLWLLGTRVRYHRANRVAAVL